MRETEFVAAVAHEIDRLVIRGHDLAGAYEPKPAAVQRLAAHPGLLNTVAIVLLSRPLTRDDVGRIVPYTPPHLLQALVDNNVSENVVADSGGELSLTEAGREIAEGVVALQEAVIDELWVGADDALAEVESILRPVIAGASDPPASPSAFVLFAPVCDRPTLGARVLRVTTAARYWRADAHRAALRAADLPAAEAHALNVLWDADRGVTRVGQGFP